MSGYDFKSDPRIVLDLARERLRSQQAAGDSLSSTIATQFAAGSALAGMLAGIFSLRNQSLGVVDLATISFSLAGYVGLVVVTVVGTWPRSWRIGPGVEWAWGRSQEVGEEMLIAEMISGYMDYWRSNEAINARRSFALRIAQGTVLFQTLCLIAALFVIAG